MEHISIFGPSITQKEIDYVTDAVTNAWYGNQAMYHKRFEKAFADYHDVEFAVALPSCTSAIHLSLLALGVGEGDEVIVPELTWIASAAPISYVGAKPVFADVDSQTWCLSPKSFESYITDRTKAVITVDLYGNVVDYDAIRAIADKHQIVIIEDAAEAIGAEYKGHKAGSLGDTGVFSFHGSKTLTTGEGGMLITNRKDVYDRVQFLRDHGRKPGDFSFYNSEVAYKYKMSSMQAALGLAQLERIDELIEHKRNLFSWYQQELSHMEGITLNYEADETKSTYWMVSAVWSPERNMSKEWLYNQFQEFNIDIRPFFYPLSSIPAYKHLEQSQHANKDNPISYQLGLNGINLPSGLDMTPEKVSIVCKAFKSIVDQIS